MDDDEHLSPLTSPEPSTSYRPRRLREKEIKKVGAGGIGKKFENVPGS